MTKFNFKILLICSLFLFLSNKGFAADWLGIVTYQISMPTGDTEKFINDYSFRGFGLDFRAFANKNTTVGFATGWNVFHERTSKTIQLNTENPGAVTGVQDRVINAFPIMLNVHQYFGKRRDIRPYVGLSAGGFFMLQQFDIGIYSFEENEWQWGMAPEIGVIIPLKGNGSIIINGKYNYAFTGDNPMGGDINHEYWMLGIGYAWGRH